MKGRGTGREGREGRREKGKKGNQDKNGKLGRKKELDAIPGEPGLPEAEYWWPRAVWVSVQRNPSLGFQGWAPKEGR